MTWDDLILRARESMPRDVRDIPGLLEWRNSVYALRHMLLDGSRGAEVADALLALLASTIRLSTTKADHRTELQDHLWNYSRLKANTTEEALGAADEICRRLRPLDTDRQRRFLTEIYSLLMGAEFELLCATDRR